MISFRFFTHMYAHTHTHTYTKHTRLSFDIKVTCTRRLYFLCGRFFFSFPIGTTNDFLSNEGARAARIQIDAVRRPTVGFRKYRGHRRSDSDKTPAVTPACFYSSNALDFSVAIFVRGHLRDDDTLSWHRFPGLTRVCIHYLQSSISRVLLFPYRQFAAADSQRANNTSTPIETSIRRNGPEKRSTRDVLRSETPLTVR